jgi:hypothetical protein
MRSRSAVMYTSFKVSITVLTHHRYNTCRVSGLVQIAITLIFRFLTDGPDYDLNRRADSNRLVLGSIIIG